MRLLYVIISIILGFILSGIWIGFTIGINVISDKFKLPVLMRFRTALAALLPTILILMARGQYMMNVQGASDIISWLLLIATVLITSMIITRKKEDRAIKGKDLLLFGLDGILMEIPQRLMMQSFLWYLLEIWGVENATVLSIFANAVVWCLGILTQCFMGKKKIDYDVYIELISSFVFSIGIGIVLARTELILLTMLAHFCERILSSLIFLCKRCTANKK